MISVLGFACCSSAQVNQSLYNTTDHHRSPQNFQCHCRVERQKKTPKFMEKMVTHRHHTSPLPAVVLCHSRLHRIRPLFDSVRDTDIKYSTTTQGYQICFSSGPTILPTMSNTIAEIAPPLSDALQMVTSQTTPLYQIKIFTQGELLTQSFLPELREVINESYRDPGVVPFDDIGTRLKSDTQLTDELTSSGFTAIAFSGTSIVGTASMKEWAPHSEVCVWKSPCHFQQFSAEQIYSGHSTVLNNLHDSPFSLCEGEVELAAVAVKPDPLYRRKGIAEDLVQACEEELKRRMSLVKSDKHSVRVMLKVVSEILGPYWLKKGFRIVGEQYCPPLTWDFKKGFVIWAMERELTLD